MPQIGSKRHLSSMAASLFVVLFMTSVIEAGATPDPGRPGASTARYEPAEQCAECHEVIHQAWSEGPHARAARSPLFLKTMEQVASASPERRRECLRCHAPTTLLSGDMKLEEPLSREGVTCDFCHTVADVDLDRPDHPFVLEPGDVKRGPFEYAESGAHETAYSPLHKASPMLCAACHEHTNAAGVAVLSTYSDWRAGPYPARGVPCQECHMAPVPGTTVKKGLKAPSLIRVVNQHRVVGGSSRSQLDRGLDLQIESFARSGGSAAFTVAVTNVAAGHPIPGGLPSKSLVLAVAVETGEGDLQHRQERVYRRELKDAQGRVLESIVDLFVLAESTGRDNRIKPRETRRERFTLTLPAGSRAVVARLEYRDSSDPDRPAATTLITETRRELTGR